MLVTIALGAAAGGIAAGAIGGSHKASPGATPIPALPPPVTATIGAPGGITVGKP
jgi:hypothetical protein